MKNKKPTHSAPKPGERKTTARTAPKSPPQPKPVEAQTEQDKTDDKLGERIQKVLARGGVGSRREIERWIEEGKVKVNGINAVPGIRLKAGDYLQINDRVVHWDKFAEQTTRVLLYHKPTGEVVTRNDPQGRPIIFSRLPELLTARWIAVGRLDINTSGLLLVTNNGELANRLMHPSTQVEREYAVRILGNVADGTLEKLKQGVVLEDGKAKFDDIYLSGGEGANKWYYVTVTEGRNRLVRRLWESQEVVVSRLIRVRYGPVVLPENLRTNAHYELTGKELDLLFEFAGMAREKHDVLADKSAYTRKR
ncbi:MAG: pseudouridine synthase [Methylovulum sp.]|nr:pseudouridine synthase [Methylovulum sp.]